VVIETVKSSTWREFREVEAGKKRFIFVPDLFLAL
jgi:hypothetical protein